MTSALPPSERWENPGSLPVTIGITGHRNPDPAALPTIRSHFLATLDRLASTLPHTPLILLSGLASGADQLAVAWASEWTAVQPRLRGGARLRVVGVLPLEREEYLKDFPSPEERACFEQTESLCSHVFTLPDPDQPGGHDGAERDQRYRDLGIFIARQSELVVAFWDGKPSRSLGGTADIVTLCLAGGRPGSATGEGLTSPGPFQRSRPLLLPDEAVPVVHIPTPRAASATDGALGRGEAGTLPHGAALQAPSFLHDRDRLNAHLAEEPSTPDASQPSCLDGDPRWDALRDRRAALSGASMSMRLRMQRSQRQTVWLVVLGITCFQILSSFFDEVDLSRHASESGGAWMRVVLMTAYLGSLLWAYRRARSQRSELRDFTIATLRALSESLRIQSTMLRAGLWDEQVGNWLTARVGQGTQPLRAMLRPCVIEALALARDSGARATLGAHGESEVQREWVEGQATYFESQLKGSSRRNRRVAAFRRGKRALAIVLLSIACLMLVFMIELLISQLCSKPSVAPPVLGGIEHLPPVRVGCFLIGLSLTAILAVELFESLQLASVELKDFKRMLEIYRLAGARTKAATCRHDRTNIIRALGKEALDEIAEWYVQHRERPVETKLG